MRNWEPVHNLLLFGATAGVRPSTNWLAQREFRDKLFLGFTPTSKSSLRHDLYHSLSARVNPALGNSGALWSHERRMSAQPQPLPESQPRNCSSCKVVGRLVEPECEKKVQCGPENCSSSKVDGRQAENPCVGANFFCGGCALILPLEDMAPVDYFSLLNL
eukprot:1191559-Prorocentrum_minimum.AAC.3